MEDENAKEDNQPTKKESQRMTSEQDLYNDRRKYDERRDEHVSNSESFTSGSYSGGSRVDMAGVRPELPKAPVVKQAKPPKKKSRVRRAGRVEKRRRSPGRRTAARRLPKRKPRKERDLSVSTMFTRLSSQSGSRSPGCKFCGHRCCRRRYEYEVMMLSRRRKIKRVPRRRMRAPKLLEGSKSIQAGSRSLMLSPLFINSNATPPDEAPEPPITHCEVTPEMIYETLRRLTMWRQYVPTSDIMEYMKATYPVNPDKWDLLHELGHKMKIAVVSGIVKEVAEGFWCLSCALQNRTLPQSHVTKFWQVYADTMRPIKRPVTENKTRQVDESQSDTNVQTTSEGNRLPNVIL